MKFHTQLFISKQSRFIPRYDFSVLDMKPPPRLYNLSETSFYEFSPRGEHSPHHSLPGGEHILLFTKRNEQMIFTPTSPQGPTSSLGSNGMLVRNRPHAFGCLPWRKAGQPHLKQGQLADDTDNDLGKMSAKCQVMQKASKVCTVM
jgi:hypothetical protein